MCRCLPKDSQSDAQSFQRLNPRFLEPHWGNLGNQIYLLVSALASGATEAAENLSPTSRLVNATACYSLLLLGVWQARRLHGAAWSSFFLPIQTVKNLSLMCVQSMSIAVACPPDCDLWPNKFSEKVSEQHYSRIKSPFHGSPSIRDGITGTQLAHTRQLRSLDPEPAKLQHDRLEKKDAARLASKCWSECYKFQAWICCDLSCDEIEACFNEWWIEEGEQMLTKGRGIDVGPELREMDELYEDHLEDMQEQDPDEGEPDERLAGIEATEDYVVAKQHLEAPCVAAKHTQQRQL